MKMLALAAVLAGGLLPAQEPPPRLSVSGVAVNAASGDPVRKVTIILRPSDETAGFTYEAESDSNGRFVIEDVGPGDYTISGDRQGFMLESEGAPGAPPANVKMEAGRSVSDVKVKLVPLGVITGRVFDDDGDPVRGARVEALAYAYVTGRKQLRPVDQVTANDKGEFRLFNLRPGTFYLRTSDRNFRFRRRLQAGRSSPGLGLTYFPSTTDEAHAVPIELAAGAQLRGFDIRLRQEMHYSVRGKLPRPARTAGDPMQNFSLQLTPAHGFANYGFGLQITDDNFEFIDVVPGSYVLICMLNGEPALFARQPVEVVNSDVEGITLNLVPGVEISGVVRVEGTPRRAQPLETLHVNLQHENPSFGQTSADVKPDGSFRMKDVVPDVYEVIVGSQGSYTKSIRLGDEEQPDRHIDLTKASGPLTILLGTDVGEVEGTVKNANGDPAVRVRVNLIAYGNHLGRIDLARFGFTDEQGKFRLRSVPPGEYKAFAWEDVPVGAPQDPEFRKPFEKQAVAVKMEPNGHQAVELTAISVKASQRKN